MNDAASVGRVEGVAEERVRALGIGVPQGGACLGEPGGGPLQGRLDFQFPVLVFEFRRTSFYGIPKFLILLAHLLEPNGFSF